MLGYIPTETCEKCGSDMPEESPCPRCGTDGDDRESWTAKEWLKLLTIGAIAVGSVIGSCAALMALGS